MAASPRGGVEEGTCGAAAETEGCWETSHFRRRERERRGTSTETGQLMVVFSQFASLEGSEGEANRGKVEQIRNEAVTLLPRSLGNDRI